MSMRSGRTPRYARNTRLEGLLEELSGLLAPAEKAALDLAPSSEKPTVLVVGAPRSGTTLMTQWLAASGAFAYPTNMLSRFFMAPAVGARIQQLLTDPRFAHGDELAGFADQVDFQSNLGKTKGPLAPNEFWYFWRRFLPTVDIERIGERMNEVDFDGLRQSLAAMAAVFEKPLMMKGMMLQYDLGAFAERLPNTLFIHVERDAPANVRSLLDARERFFGDTSSWYSAKPPEYEALVGLPPVNQVAGQVVHTNRHIAQALDSLPFHRSLHVQYEEFCQDPTTTWSKLAERMCAFDEAIPASHPDTTPFRATRRAEPDADGPIENALRTLNA